MLDSWIHCYKPVYFSMICYILDAERSLYTEYYIKNIIRTFLSVCLTWNSSYNMYSITAEHTNMTDCTSTIVHQPANLYFYDDSSRNKKRPGDDKNICLIFLCGWAKVWPVLNFTLQELVSAAASSTLSEVLGVSFLQHCLNEALNLCHTE